MSNAALRTLAGQLGVTVEDILAPDPTPSPASASSPSPGGPLQKSTLLTTIRNVGAGRAREGGGFFEDDELPGSFLYSTGATRVGICVWGGETTWLLSIFSAARVQVRPGLAVYRFIARWRTTEGIGAAYVVEDGTRAAIMCERLFVAHQFADGPGAAVMVETTIDLVGRSADTISRALRDAADGGEPFTAEGLGGLMALKSWWETSDPNILDTVRRLER